MLPSLTVRLGVSVPLKAFSNIMQSSLTFNDDGILMDFDNCFGFLFDDYLEQYSKSMFLLPCDSRDYIDMDQASHDEPLPIPGEFPMVDLVPGSHMCAKAILTEISFGVLSNLSEDELSHWWGINQSYSDHFQASNDPSDVAVSIGSGLSHFRDIILVAEQEQQGVALEVPVVCPMSLLFHFYMPIMTLCLTGFPTNTRAATLLKLLRLFGSVYNVYVDGENALCTMASETAYNVILELHAHVVNGVRLFFSF